MQLFPVLYNYYKLAVQNWCSMNDYKIHGLWADVNASFYPTHCQNTSFNMSELQTSPHFDEIMEKWYDCSYDQTVSLYDHEWSKHGTCISAQTGFTQNEYFEKTVDLYSSYSSSSSSSSPICFDLMFVPIQCP